MIAYLLAAGNGMRLRPLTDNFQKCLLPVNGKPMLEHWLDAVFGSWLFQKVFVNVHYCAPDVEKWLAQYFERTGHSVKIIDERENLLGTAGTIFEHGNRDHDFMLAYTDTYSDHVFKNLSTIALNWASNNNDGMVGGLISFPSPKDKSAGAMVIDSVGVVKTFNEKSDDGDVVWAGVMFARKIFYDYMTPFDKDIARDVMPRLTNKLRVISHVEAYDIGRGVECYEKFAGRNAS